MSSAWPMVPLGEVLVQYKEYIEAPEAKLYPKLSVKLYGKGVELDPPTDGTMLKMKRHQLAKAGQVILSEIWGKKGAIGLVPDAGEGALCTSHFFLFDVHKTKMMARWLEYIFKANYLADQLDAEAKGTTGYAAVRPAHLLKATIPLPPLAEQRRLVERIDGLAVKVEEAKRLRDTADKAATLLLGQEVRRIFDDGKADGWQQRKLGDVIIEASYGTSEKTCDDEAGTPILRMGNIQDGRLRTTDLKYLYFSQRDRDAYLLERGDILVNRTNSAELVGKCAVFDLEGEFGYASYIIRLRVDDHQANPFLVAHFINSPIGRAYMVSEKKQMTGQANVNTVKLRALPIWLPPRDEQDAILDHIERLRSLRQEMRRQQDIGSRELNAILPAILDRAFRGELS